MMEFTADRAALHAALAPAARIAKAGDSGLPILNCVRVSVDHGRVTVSATDLVTSIVASAPLDDKGTTGDFAIAGKDLAQAIASAPGAKVSFKATTGWVEIKSGKARWKLPTIAARDFPKILEPDRKRDEITAEVSAAHLGVLIDCTAYAASKDESRAHLCGVWYRHDGERGSVTAGDGHRFSTVNFAGAGPRIPKGVIIPSKSLGEIAKLISGAESCTLAIARKSLFVTVADRTVSTRLVDLNYPPMAQVTESVLKSATKHVVVSKAALVGSIKRVAPATTETRGLRMATSEGALKVEAGGTMGSPSEISDVLEVADLPDIKVGVNAKYLLDAVNCIAGDSVRLRFGGELDPIVITTTDDDSQLCIVMPMRDD